MTCSLGLEQAGFDLLASVEYDPVHATTHSFNFPTTEVLCDDMSTLDVAAIREAAARGWEAHRPGAAWDGEVDLVAGGPPCQGFSMIGKRDVGDSRNDLIFHFFRAVTEPRILNAADYGVPQDRRRLILLGAREGLAPLAYPPPTARPVRPVRSGWPADDRLGLGTRGL